MLTFSLALIEFKYMRCHMDMNDFIISTLTVRDDMIYSIDKHPTCPCYGGYINIKYYSSYSYNHLGVAGIPSIIDWTRYAMFVKNVGSPSLIQMGLAQRWTS